MQNSHQFEVKSQLNFKSQGIQLDFLAFEFDQSSFNREFLIDYFFRLGFNAFEHTGYNKHKNWVTLLEKSTHKHQIVFRQPNVVRDWRLLHFSGRNAHRFYALVKQNRIDWNVFAGSKLTRLDTAYSHSIKKSEPPIEDYFLEIEKIILESPYQKAQDFKFENNEKGLIIRIGNRKHIHYLRIYKRRENTNLRFEHEFKSKPKLNNLFNLLKSNEFKEFEKESILRFTTHLAQRLPCSYCFTDWVYFIIRPLSTQLFRNQIVEQSLYYQTDYMDSQFNKIVKVKLFDQHGREFDHIVDSLLILQFLRFLEFLRNLDFQTDQLSHNGITANYRVFVFELRTFLETSFTSNSYQMAKLKIFIEILQTQAIIQFFHEKNFKYISAIPLANVAESLEVGQPLIATVWVSEPLFRYKFPFSLPKFSTNTTKLATRVWAYWTQQFATKDIQKVFNLSEFFQNYPAQLNSKQKQVIKNELLKAVEYYSKVQLIDQKFQIIEGQEFKSVEELTLQNISQGFVIYEKINPNLFYS
jgi:hypothetical protein